MTAVGVYLEFRNATATTQIIVTPEAQHPGDPEVRVAASTIYRLVSKTSPRAQWHVSSISELSEEVPNYVAEATAQIAKGVEMCYSPEWKLMDPVMFVELSSDDIHLIHDVTVPDALLRRVDRVRASGSYPEDLYIK
jgi:hypothetical protein